MSRNAILACVKNIVHSEYYLKILGNRNDNFNFNRKHEFNSEKDVCFYFVSNSFYRRFVDIYILDRFALFNDVLHWFERLRDSRAGVGNLRLFGKFKFENGY